MNCTRREFVSGLTLAGTAGLLGVRPDIASAEPPPETTRIRLIDLPSACLAPQYMAEELLRAEGFARVQFIKVTDYGPAVNKALVSDEIDFLVSDPPNHVAQVDGGAPVIALAGIHAGCYELLGTDQVRSIRDLKGKTVAVPALGNGRHLLIAAMAASIGLDPARDIIWVVHPEGESMQLFVEGKIDAFLGFPPEPQELRAKKIGRVLLNTLTDRPWSQYFCCMMSARREFVRTAPVATKRALRAILKATDLCALEPERAARFVVGRGFARDFDSTLQLIKEIGYRQWRQYNPEETIRFYALRLHEVGFIKSGPQKIIAQGTDWRLLNELKKELKG